MRLLQCLAQQDGSVNLAHLLVGSEGTLAYSRELTLKLAPLHLGARVALVSACASSTVLSRTLFNGDSGDARFRVVLTNG